MFNTPPPGIKTRSVTRREAEQTKVRKIPSEQLDKDTARSEVSRKSGQSSVAARIKRLELEAAEAKARLENEAAQRETKLIEMRLAAEVAALEEEKSHRSRKTHSIATTSTHEKVENWMERSNVNDEGPHMHYDGRKLPVEATRAAPTDIQQLVYTLKDAFNSVASDAKNKALLSRISSCKDLPIFDGDCLEWLQFKQSYIESTEACNFTDVENLWRLRKCLRGEAKETVTSLLMGNTTPATIIDALQLRYGRPEAIILKLVQQLKKTAPLPLAYHSNIVPFAIKIMNYVAAVKAIKQDDYLRSPELLTVVISKCPSTLISKWTDYFFTCSDEKRSKLEILAEFLHIEASKTAVVGVSHIITHTEQAVRKRPDDYRSPYNLHPVNEILHTTPSTSKMTDEADKCKFCKTNKHALAFCPQFKRALRRNRWHYVRIHKLCFKCLESRHNKDTCPAKECDIDGCNRGHHCLLHWPLKKDENEKKDDEDDEPLTDIVAHAVVKTSSRLLLKVVPVTVHGPKGDVKTYALLDDGAALSLMSADIADEVGLRGNIATLNAKSAWTSSKITCEVENISCTISNSQGERYTLHARKMKELDLATQTILHSDIIKYQHLRDNDQLLTYTGNVKPKILIGHDHYHLLAPQSFIAGLIDEPYATKTSLGWCVHGFVGAVNGQIKNNPHLLSSELRMLPAENEHPMLHVSTNEDNDILLHDEVKRSFAFDAIGVTKIPRQNADDQRAISILENTAKLIDGRWEVGLPWKSDAKLPDSYMNAYKRLRTVEKKMLMNNGFASRYKERVEHLLVNDYARELNDDGSNKPRVWYLPHFGVDNPNKKKLRLVFDAAAVSGGHCLNDYLLQGADLLQSLLGIMMRFREEPVGIIGDIKDMFLRVKIIEQDQHALRFLWRKNQNVPIKEYVMTSLIFGANCSPFVAQYIKNKNALRFKSEMPEAVNAILKSHYMDDYVDSQGEHDAKKLIKDITYIYAQGGFEIRSFLSNNQNVLHGISETALNDKAVDIFKESLSERTLGLLWYPASDTFGFDLSFKRISKDLLGLKQKPTKRELLRIVMSIFDVYGFLAPFTIKGKIILQSIWKTNTHWDDKIPDNSFESFKDWMSQLMRLRDLRIPRWYLRSAETKLESASIKDKAYELHIFCDASPTAYAAVAYWRVILKHTHTDVLSPILTSFIASKCRVTPVKAVSIPRLELQAAILSCRLAETIQTAHRLNVSERYFWTDSTTVLHWIRNDTRSYKTFVANRLGEIDSLTEIKEWHYVPTSMNPADKATKINSYELSYDCGWFTGPDFLFKDNEHWPLDPTNEQKINKDILEICTVYNIEKIELPVPDPKRFSSWLRLLRSTAAVLLFTKKCQKIANFEMINCQLLESAERLLMRHAQSETFQNEISRLSQGNQIERNSRLRTLTPVIGEDGLLHVDGRVNAAQNVDTQMKNPIILDGRCHISRLIVKHYHERAAHAGNEMVINELRQKYWIVNMRPTVRRVASQCLMCRKRKTTPTPARLGNLPLARLAHHERPFSHCGIHLFGPMEVAVGRQRVKRYGVLFTCMTIRGIHIEVVSSLTTDSLIMSLRRMAARRGWPRRFYSDNGTNLRGAEAELKRAYQAILQTGAVQSEVVNRGVDWYFIPPASPHMGGAWERLIRSVKTALRVILKERAPREEVLTTLLTEIENMVNSRPLTHVSVDPTSKEALTPNHFLLGSSSGMPTPGDFCDGDLCSRKQWRIAQRLSDMYWQRWLKEVLPMMLPRQRWNQDERPLREGDLVLVVDNTLPRNTWPMGVVEKTYPGGDGRVRVVDVKTSRGTFRRPVTRVALLPMDPDEEC